MGRVPGKCRTTRVANYTVLKKTELEAAEYTYSKTRAETWLSTNEAIWCKEVLKNNTCSIWCKEMYLDASKWNGTRCATAYYDMYHARRNRIRNHNNDSVFQNVTIGKYFRVVWDNSTGKGTVKYLRNATNETTGGTWHVLQQTSLHEEETSPSTIFL